MRFSPVRSNGMHTNISSLTKEKSSCNNKTHKERFRGYVYRERLCIDTLLLKYKTTTTIKRTRIWSRENKLQNLLYSIFSENFPLC